MALDQIGPYKFLGVLGRGGMGTVYRATHVDSGELHAVKVLAPTYAHDAHFRSRFKSEIQALIKLDHPNIVRLKSYGQEDAMLFFSMELVEGNSLFQVQKSGHRFNWREVIAIATDVGHGLRHAHDRGIIHRDLKPGNLLMTVDENGEHNRVKLTDFGIAKRFGTSQNTGDNVLGTMDFMSPEQARGEAVTIRSDLYSLGTVMFTLLSGKPPFTSNSVEQSLRNLTRVPPPRISSLVPNVPPELDELISKLLSKRPDDRIQTAQALLHQLQEIQTTLRSSSEAPTEHPASATDLQSDNFDLAAPKTIQSTRVKKKSDKTDVATQIPQTIESTDHHREQESPSAAHTDYFNTVTDQVRQSQNQDTEELEKKTSIKDIWPIALALLAVIGLGVFGVFQSTRPPDAELLYAQIEARSDQPNRVMDEIGQFLKHYPQHDQAAQVEELQRIGEAIRLYNSLANTLAVRKNVPGESRLTAIEKRFVEIAELAKDDPASAQIKMAAIVTVHGDSEELEPRDQKCIEAARSYQIKIEHDTRTNILFNLKQIRAAMKETQAIGDPEIAIEKYRSILELYAPFDWGNLDVSQQGRDLVATAKTVLGELEAKQKKPSTDDQENSDSN